MAENSTIAQRLFHDNVLPACATSAVLVAGNLVDAAVTGQCLGKAAVAAFGIANPILLGVIGLSGMLGVGTVIEIGQALGRGAKEKSQPISMYGEKVTEMTLRTAVEAMAEESETTVLEYSVYADTSSDPGHYVVLLESDREVSPEHWPVYSEILNRKLCQTHDSYCKKIQQKIMLPLEVKFVQSQTYALYRDLKGMGGASPNQIKPLHVIPEGRVKRFFFALLQD